LDGREDLVLDFNNIGWKRRLGFLTLTILYGREDLVFDFNNIVWKRRLGF